jgi:integrase
MSVRIVPCKAGGWTADIRVRRASGQRYRERRNFKTRSKTAVRHWAERREHELLEHGPVVHKEEVPTLKQFGPRFLEGYARANRHKPSGVSHKEIALRVHLVPLLGSKPLDMISNTDVQKLKEHLQAKAVKTVNNVLTVLSKLLKVAVEWQIIEQMPCSIHFLKNSERPMQFWDFDQYQRLVDAAAQLDSSILVAVLLGGDAGLRKGEMIALKWTDIDLHAKRVYVARSDWRGQVGTTKGNRMRAVPLTERLLDALRRHRSLKSELVLCNDKGTALSANGLSYLVERATRRSGLATTRKPKGAGPHVLRHTFCSHLAMKGAPAKAIQELAGHRDLATTMRYMHLSPATIESAIRLLELPAPMLGGNSGALEVAAARMS